MIRVCALAFLGWLASELSAHAQAQLLLIPEAAEAVEGLAAREFIGGLFRGAGQAAGSAAVNALIDGYRNGRSNNKQTNTNSNSINYPTNNNSTENQPDNGSVDYPADNDSDGYQPDSNSGEYEYPAEQQAFAPVQTYEPPAYQQQCWTENRRELINTEFDHREFAGQWVQPNGLIVTNWHNVFRNTWRNYTVTHCE